MARYRPWEGNFGGWGPSVTNEGRRLRAGGHAREVARRLKGRAPQPIEIEGRTLATTVWGKAWCANLESYAELSSRLVRGRSYVRSGTILDLAVSAGEIRAFVAGTFLYEVRVRCEPVGPASWAAIRDSLRGKVRSLLSLFQGDLEDVMSVLARRDAGLFPAPGEIEYECTCPDAARGGAVWMCKHIAATLYGFARRLDDDPSLLFTLRRTDPNELVAHAAKDLTATQGPGRYRRLDGGADLKSIFGIEVAESTTRYRRRKRPKARRRPS